jgi:hypothetical protein
MKAKISSSLNENSSDDGDSHVTLLTAHASVSKALINDINPQNVNLNPPPNIQIQ